MACYLTTLLAISWAFNSHIRKYIVLSLLHVHISMSVSW